MMMDTINNMCMEDTNQCAGHVLLTIELLSLNSLLQPNLFYFLSVKKKNELNPIIQTHLLMLGQLLTILILLEKEGK